MSLHSTNRPRPRKPWQWIDIRGRRTGMWAFALNRLTGIGLVVYLYLHFVMLSQLLQGPAAWDAFVALARSPLVLVFDVVLFAGLVIHGLNGFRVALTPVIVLIGFRLPILIGGSVIIEQVFQWPGHGNLFVTAVRNKDLPVVMTIALFSVVLVLVVSLLIDVLTAIIDPRVRLGG